MLILAIDTSGKSSSVSLVGNGEILAEIYLNCSLTHSRTICGTVRNLLRSTATSLSEVDVFAVCVGPGSYTGIRIGVSLVKGFSLSSSKKCIGVSSLCALACSVQDISENDVVYSCIKANSEEFYFNSYIFDKLKGHIVPEREDGFLKFLDLSRIVKYEKRKIIIVTNDSCIFGMNFEKYEDKIKRLEVHSIKSSFVGVLANHLISEGCRCDLDNLKPNYLKEVKIDKRRSI